MAQEELKIVLDAQDNASPVFKKAGDEAKGFGDKLGGASKEFPKFQKSIAGTNQTLLNFGRVVQDAPFGIIGIANNIDPLISSFQALQKSTGSTGGALKALFAGLAGPAGIAIGISAATSALIAFGPQIKAFFQGNKEGAAAAEAAAKATEDLDKAVASFSVTIATSAGKDKAALDALVGGVKNLNLSQEQRLYYVDELQKKYPAYFGNLSKEQILAGDTAAAYNQLSIDIVKAAKARAAGDIVAKLAGQQLQNEFDETKRLIGVQKDLRNVRTFTQQTASGGTGGVGGVSVVVKAEDQRNEIIQKSVAISAEYTAKQKALNKEIGFYTKFVDEGAAATANLGAKQAKATKATTDSTKALTNAQREGANFLNEDLKIRAANIPLLKATADETNKIAAAAKALNEQNRIAQALSKLGAGLAPANIDPNKGIQAAKNVQDAVEFQQQSDNTLKQISQNAAIAGQVFDKVLTPAIDATIDALARGEDVGKALANVFKQVLAELIKTVIKAAALAAITSAIGGGGFGANFLKAILPGRANGGPVGAGSPYVVGESGPELFVPQTAGSVVPNMALGGGGTLSATVSGNDLLFILNQAGSNRRNNFG